MGWLILLFVAIGLLVWAAKWLSENSGPHPERVGMGNPKPTKDDIDRLTAEVGGLKQKLDESLAFNDEMVRIGAELKEQLGQGGTLMDLYKAHGEGCLEDMRKLEAENARLKALLETKGGK